MITIASNAADTSFVQDQQHKAVDDDDEVEDDMERLNDLEEEHSADEEDTGTQGEEQIWNFSGSNGESNSDKERLTQPKRKKLVFSPHQSLAQLHPTNKP